MDKMKPEAEKNKLTLTDDQKADIRNEMVKCQTPDEARKHRLLLAEYYGVTVQQVIGVAAYKRRLDGGLSLEPQFSKSPDTAQVDSDQHVPSVRSIDTVDARPTAAIEKMYDNPTKRAWRVKILETIKSDFETERLHNARVVCLPGQALQEVREIYIPLGIQPENIICIEREQVVANIMRANSKAMNLPVTIFEGSVEKFLSRPHDPIDIASFDFLGPIHTSFLEALENLRVSDKCIVITNFLRKRETTDPQDQLKVFTSVNREKAANQGPEITEFNFGSEKLKWRDSFKTYEEHVSEITSGQTEINLSDARNEGLVMTLLVCLAQGRGARAYEDLYADTGVMPPQASVEEIFHFLDSADTLLAEFMESEFIKYPNLLKKLTPLRQTNEKDELIRYSNAGKRGFLQNLAAMISDCLMDRQVLDVQRFAYKSETSGSPYQTDIVSVFNFGPSLKHANEQSFDFIRESYRALRENGREALSLKLEKFGRTLPKAYSDGTPGITLVLEVNGVMRVRVSLINLLQLVAFYRKLASSNNQSGSDQLLSRARTEIKPE